MNHSRSADPPARHVVDVRPVDDRHAVVTVEGGTGPYRRRPCSGCPWRIDQTGAFPAGAFAESARTAYDLSQSMFACHQAGIDSAATCAGFLLRGATHNLAVRLRILDGTLDLDQVHDGGHALHPGYLSMALANGAPPDALHGCRRSPDEEDLLR